jgi:hypothetical protein
MSERWRVTMTPHNRKRICTKKFWESKEAAQKYADDTNKNYQWFARARVVKDSERVRRMIP